MKKIMEYFHDIRRIAGYPWALAMILSLAMASSCSKEGPARFKGDYTFKTGGTILLKSIETSEEGTEPAVSDTVRLELVPEGGQMTLAEKGGDDLVVTMNIIGGSVVTCDAKASGRDLEILPSERTIKAEHPGHVSPLSFQVTSAGYGNRYDDVLILRFDYTGEVEYEGRKYEIAESAVDCVAKENE